MRIQHVTDREAWAAALEKDAYCGDTLDTQGFIHCCLPDQLQDVLREWFPDRTDLVVLEIDSQLLKSTLKFELPPGGQEKFPHIYGPINLDAVVSMCAVEEIR